MKDNFDTTCDEIIAILAKNDVLIGDLDLVFNTVKSRAFKHTKIQSPTSKD